MNLKFLTRALLPRRLREFILTPSPAGILERTEVVSPERFLQLYQQVPQSIRSARVLPPAMGSPDFGNIVIVRRLEPIRTHLEPAHR